MTETVGRPVGRRERKKAATRQALADAALRLFLAHGYDQVSVKDVAEAADVSTTTLFKHFSGKEALVFDEDADREAALVAAVRDRAPGQTVFESLRDYILRVRTDGGSDPELRRFLDLVNNTPALRRYARGMWMRHELALARAIAEETGAAQDDPACAALAHFALEAPAFGRDHPDPRQAVVQAFELLQHGWQTVHSDPAPAKGNNP